MLSTPVKNMKSQASACAEFIMLCFIVQFSSEIEQVTLATAKAVRPEYAPVARVHCILQLLTIEPAMQPLSPVDATETCVADPRLPIEAVQVLERHRKEG